MKNQELTPEEREMFKGVLTNDISRLVVGANLAHFDAGTDGQEAYSLMTGEKKIQEDYFEKLREKKSGSRKIVGEPGFTLWDYSDGYARRQEQAKQVLSLGDLEEITSGIAKGFEFKVPEKLKNYSFANLFEKAKNEKGRFDESKLSEDEKYAFESWSTLNGAYEKAIKAEALDSTRYVELNAVAKKIEEKYSPK